MPATPTRFPVPTQGFWSGLGRIPPINLAEWWAAVEWERIYILSFETIFVGDVDLSVRPNDLR